MSSLWGESLRTKSSDSHGVPQLRNDGDRNDAGAAGYNLIKETIRVFGGAVDPRDGKDLENLTAKR